MSSLLGDLARTYLHAIRIDDVMSHLARLTEHDRYQASLGIERAADFVATTARAIGLQDVIVERFAADGSTPWWTFQAPRAWTPTTARLEVRSRGQTLVAVDHAEQPFTIATYSAPTPSTGLVTRIAGFADDVRDALVVVRPADFARPTLVAELVARGAVGFVTDGPSRHGLPGRIELSSDATLFAFSVTTAHRELIETGREAHICVAVDRSARMPVVTGVLPGRSADEVWLTSHLCHPRPGANDNASGAAGLLGVAAALVEQRANGRERTVRFVWGPEFVGVAALIHQRYARGSDVRPVAVINLDMIGEDPLQCEVPLVIERPPDWCPSLLAPVAEHVAKLVFEQTSTDAGAWRPGPFYGFSDHALFASFADPAWRSPAVQLWHPGDPFNHSAADTLDKVSPIQMRRAIAIGTVLADVLARDSEPRDELAQIVEEWISREEHGAAAIADRYRGTTASTKTNPATNAGAGPTFAWSDRYVAHVSDRAAVMRELVEDGLTARMLAPRPPAQLSTERRSAVYEARWPGPFNYRGLLAALSPTSRDGVTALFLADKRNYAVLTHLAMLASTSTTRDEAVEAASFALRGPIDSVTAERLWAALFESGWLAEAGQ